MSVVTRQTDLAVLWLWLTRLKPMHSRKLNWTTITSKPQMIANFLSPKGKGLDTCYTATYMSQTRDQLRFTISEVAADWHEPMVPQRIM